MVRTGKLMMAVAALAGTALTSLGTAWADAPIHTYSRGENTEIIYHGDTSANILGGGRVVTRTSGSGEESSVTHLDPAFAHPVPGIPRSVGRGENSQIVYEQNRNQTAQLEAERGRGDVHLRHHQQ